MGKRLRQAATPQLIELVQGLLADSYKKVRPVAEHPGHSALLAGTTEPLGATVAHIQHPKFRPLTRMKPNDVQQFANCLKVCACLICVVIHSSSIPIRLSRSWFRDIGAQYNLELGLRKPLSSLERHSRSCRCVIVWHPGHRRKF